MKSRNSVFKTGTSTLTTWTLNLLTLSTTSKWSWIKISLRTKSFLKPDLLVTSLLMLLPSTNATSAQKWESLVFLTNPLVTITRRFWATLSMAASSKTTPTASKSLASNSMSVSEWSLDPMCPSYTLVTLSWDARHLREDKTTTILTFKNPSTGNKRSVPSLLINTLVLCKKQLIGTSSNHLNALEPPLLASGELVKLHAASLLTRLSRWSKLEHLFANPAQPNPVLSSPNLTANQWNATPTSTDSTTQCKVKVLKLLMCPST